MVVQAMREKSVDEITRKRRFQREFRSGVPAFPCSAVSTTGIIPFSRHYGTPASGEKKTGGNPRGVCRLGFRTPDAPAKTVAAYPRSSQ
jgi:hypothetical protein